MKQALVLLFMAAYLIGCAGRGTLPQTPEQGVYVAWGTYVALTNTAADLADSGALSLDSAQNIQAKLAATREQLEALRRLVDGGQRLPETAIERLQLVQKLLMELQLQLQQEANQ